MSEEEYIDDVIGWIEVHPEIEEKPKGELKPCPFCGKENTRFRKLIEYKNGERSPANIKCMICNFHIISFDGDAECIEKWNTRPREDALQARIDVLEKQLEEFKAELELEQNPGYRSEALRQYDKIRELSDAEIEELGAREAEKKVFCPNCEKDTECEFTAELYECKECGEDFAKYIVGRNPNFHDIEQVGLREKIIGDALCENLRNRLEELKSNVIQLIGFIKTGQNAKAHLQMLVVETFLDEKPSIPDVSMTQNTNPDFNNH